MNYLDEENNYSKIVKPADNSDEYVMKLPESEKKEETIIEPNKKAHWSMRIAGAVIDACIMFLIMLGFRQIFVNTAMGDEMYRNYYAAVDVSDEYKLKPLVEGSDETFGYQVYATDDGYQDYVKKGYREHVDEFANKYVVANHETISEDLRVAFNKAVTSDERYKNYNFNGRLIEFGIIALAGTISEVICLLIIPLLNKRRASLGKLAAGTQVINSKYEVEAKWYQMVGRFFWTLVFESIIPLFFLSSVVWTPAVVCPVLFLITLTNKKGKTLHDFVSRTMVIDKKSFVKLEDQ